MSDEEIDKVFKQAAKGFSIDTDMSGWKDMAAKLDQSNKTVWYRSKSAYIILACLFVGSSIGLLYTSAREEHVETNVENKHSAEPSNAILSENNVVNKRSHQTSADRVQKPEQDVGSSIVEMKITPRTQVPEKPGPLNDRQGEILNVDDKPVLTSTPFSNDNRLAQYESTHGILSPATSTEHDSATVVKFEEEEEEDLILHSDSVASEQPQGNGVENVYRFSTKVSIAPDFSSTELFNQGKPGFDMGITIGYNFNTHWSVYTGAILSRKIYSSTNVEASYTASGYNYPISKLDGDCRILDIPLNVYYGFNQHRSLSFKVGVGFSSYIMFSEEYTYFVDKPYGSTEYHQRVENENNEWFKMANLSFVVQKRLNRHFFLEVEPFVKLPIAGIGAGDIQLYSVGGFLSLRYDFYKRE